MISEEHDLVRVGVTCIASLLTTSASVDIRIIKTF